MNRDVFHSLLALDSYNRGYGQNVLIDLGDSRTDQNETGRTLGTTTIVRSETTQKVKDAGFYAIAYEWNGETIISYRGTNFLESISLAEFVNFLAEDFGGGWDIFTGIGNGSHAKLARDTRQEALH
jgi:hypothetical protein